MASVAADLILLHARQMFTCRGPAPRRGAAQRDAGRVPDGALASSGGRIVYAGPTRGLRDVVEPSEGCVTIDLEGACSLVPGFVDAHTHAAYAGDRRAELQRRLAGETYAQIAAAGGGILSTVAATRAADAGQIAEATRPRLDEMLACGTTTCEIKSGYGLTPASELALLRAIGILAARHPLSIVSTFLGAHAIPPEYRSARHDYVRLVIDEMLPAVAAERLADWCDVFCEDGWFSPEESEAILRAGMAHGLRARVHADELASSGGARVAAAVGARSADHLLFVAPDDIARLAAGGTAATLLPAAAFYLKLGRFAPARALIEAGVPVALGTDVNPGGGLSPSMPFTMAIACFMMDMTFEEALVAATLNGAWSLDRDATAGSLEAGRDTDLVVIRGDGIDLLRVGASVVQAVLKRGRLVHGTLPGLEAG